ncbi:hypothetical protein PybrP1_010618, partial [[Pythium] brassicae (nom. inval.)]
KKNKSKKPTAPPATLAEGEEKQSAPPHAQLAAHPTPSRLNTTRSFHIRTRGAMSSRAAAIGDYVVTSKLGSGSFATVYKGYHKTSKYMRRQDQKAAAAAAASASNSSANSATSSASSSSSSIVGAVPTTKREPLSEAVAHHFLNELAKGMLCLWSHNLIHRDLKPQNLLLVEDSASSALKIADFGFARHLATTSLAETLCGSPLYMAPEILKFQKYDAKADLWSVGTIVYEMVVGKPPYGGSNHVQLLANIERNDLRFPATVELSGACKNLLLGLLQRKPATRMGFDDFFHHPFVGLRELSQSTLGAMSLSVSRSTATTSIREEDEDMDDEQQSSGAATTTSPAEPAAVIPPPASTNERSASDSPDSPSPSDSALRHSRSDNLEVMQTAFGSTSSAGSAALRRSSRLGRSRRATSSGAILVNQQTTSPKLSPQMSPHMLPSPSPRINPFKRMAESPPGGLQSSTLLRASGGFMLGSQRLARPAAAMPTVPPTGMSGVRPAKGGGLDSSDEYVLVDSGTEKAAGSPPAAAIHGTSNLAPERTMALRQPASSSPQDRAPLLNEAQLATQPLRPAVAGVSHEYGQQLVDIVMLRTQAISPIAEQLWKLSSSASGTAASEQRESASGSGTNLASMFSMGSSMSSSAGGGGQALVGASSSSMTFEDGGSGVLERKQYVFAAEALALYVKCLRIVQQGITYLRQDPSLSKRLTSSSSSSLSSPAVAWSEASRKLSMAYLTEQLNCFLERAEQCKKRMTSFVASADAARVEELHNAVVSQEELLYTHAIRLGKQGAVKEVLGQTRLAYEHYLQSMLLLETLLVDATPPSVSPTGAATALAGAPGALAVDDQKCVNAFLKALDERLKNVKQALDDESRGASEQQQQQQQLSFARFAVPLS